MAGRNSATADIAAMSPLTCPMQSYFTGVGFRAVKEQDRTGSERERD